MKMKEIAMSTVMDLSARLKAATARIEERKVSGNGRPVKVGDKVRTPGTKARGGKERIGIVVSVREVPGKGRQFSIGKIEGYTQSTKIQVWESELEGRLISR